MYLVRLHYDVNPKEKGGGVKGREKGVVDEEGGGTDGYV